LVACALGSRILAYPPRIVEQEICLGSARNPALSSGMLRSPGPPPTFSSRFQPPPPYLIIRPVRRRTGRQRSCRGM